MIIKFLALLINIPLIVAKTQKITSTNFSAVREQKKHLFIKAGANWCAYCEKIDPEWDKLSIYFEKNKDIQIRRYDATYDKGLAEKLNLIGYPMIIYFPPDSEQFQEFTGPKDFEGFVEFVSMKVPGIKPLPKPFEHLNSNNFFKALIKDSIILFYYDRKISNFENLLPYDKFIKLNQLTSTIDDISIFGVDCRENINFCRKKFIDHDYPFIKIYQKETKKFKSVDPNLPLEQLIELINEFTGADLLITGERGSNYGRSLLIEEIMKKGHLRWYNDFEKNYHKYRNIKNIDLYLLIYKKFLEKGYEYFNLECERLKKLIENNSNIRRSDIDRFKAKQNILLAIAHIINSNKSSKLEDL